MTDREIIYNFLEKIKKEVIDNSIKAGQRASGDTYQEMTVEANDSVGVLLVPAYFEVLETGRKEGKNPPISPIIKWIQAKGIKTNNVVGLAYGISKKIGLEGTILYQKGGRKDIYTSVIEKAKPEIRNTFSEKYVSLIQAELKLAVA